MPPQPPWVFSIRGLRLYFPELEPWIVQSVSLPHCSSQFIYARMWGQGRSLLAVALPAPFHSPPSRWISQPLPCHESVSAPPTGLGVSSLSPWLLDFHTVQFSVTSGCFLFLNCCSFGCERRCSVSTYAPILARSFLYSS